jgi:type VI secretion system protein VasI
MDGEQLYVRAAPFSESRIEMTFNITGIEDEIAPLREACSW